MGDLFHQLQPAFLSGEKIICDTFCSKFGLSLVSPSWPLHVLALVLDAVALQRGHLVGRGDQLPHVAEEEEPHDLQRYVGLQFRLA